MGSGGIALRTAQIMGIYFIIISTLFFLFTLTIVEHETSLNTEQTQNFRQIGGFDPNDALNSTLPGTDDADIPSARSVIADYWSLMFFNISISTDNNVFMEYWWIVRLIFVYIPLFIFLLSLIALIWI